MGKRFALSISSGLLLGICWVEITGFFPLVFVALVPFLILEDIIFEQKLAAAKVYVHAFIIFALFNLVSSWWIYHASAAGLAMAVIFGSALVAFPFWFFHLTRKYIGNKEGYIAFVVNILAFEWLDYNWALSHPWLSLGNVFASAPSVVQWYEYTGVAGGSLWIVLVNLVVFFAWKQFAKSNSWVALKMPLIGISLLILLPLIFSYFIGSNVDLGENNPKMNIVLSQPNVDPYQKFGNAESSLSQTYGMLDVTREVMQETTSLLVTPETAIPSMLEESGISHSDEVAIIKEFLSEYPNSYVLSGASTYSFFEKENSHATRQNKQGEYWESYNSALLIDTAGVQDVYHKSKLVLGVEVLPFGFITKPLESLFDLGGASGSLGIEKEAKNFEINGTQVAPTICYESIYGEYMAEFCRKGAGIVAVSTNDAWWYDTPGYKQLLAYAQLRAIENRRWIARSANTGISCFINPKGEIVKRTGWEETTAIAMDVPIMTAKTLYTNTGDWLYRIAIFIAPLLILLSFVRRFKKKGF